MLKIAPSLLSADFSKLKQEIKMVEEAGCDILHLDVMDGHFVPNITFGPFIVRAIDKMTEIPLDVHLMITNPEKYSPEFISAGADWLSFHIEAMNSIQDTKKLIESIKERNVKAGIVINPPTPVDEIEPVINLVDFVLVMTVNPGFGEQELIPEPLDKVRRLKKLGVMVEVDGGVKEDNFTEVLSAGADILVSGSGIFKAKNPIEVIRKMKEGRR